MEKFPARILFLDDGEFLNAYLVPDDADEPRILVASLMKALAAADASAFAAWRKVVAHAVACMVAEVFGGEMPEIVFASDAKN